MAQDEVRLRGGWMQKVVRVGDTVRRAPRGDVEFIRRLLRHLETAGFADVPRWIGVDDKGRDILSFVEGEVPHAWLFPRCAVVVHHGGYGTVHTAIAARRPMIIYPFHTDQFLWAARMGELGIGPGFTARLRDLSAARLASDLGAVRAAWHEARAEQLAVAVAADRGLDAQLAAIDVIVEHTRRGLDPISIRWPMTAVA